MNGKKRIYHLIGCLGVCGFIFAIRNALIYPTGVVRGIHDIFKLAAGVIEAFNLTEVFQVIGKVPPAIVVSIFSIFVMLMGFIVFMLFNRSIRYSYKLVQSNFIGVLKRGGIIFLAECLIIGVFTFSVIGIPFAAFVFLVVITINLYGFVPLAMVIGENVQDIFKGNDRRLSYNYVIGSICMLLCINVHAVGVAFLAFIIPVVASGTAFYTFENKFFRRPVDENDFDDKNLFDKRKIRDIITKGLDL